MLNSTHDVNLLLFCVIPQLPVDLSTLSEAEKAARLEKRKPKRKIVVEEKLENSFDFNRYSHLWKKK